MRRVAHRTDIDASEDDHLLRYHHYTVVMNRLRRLCFFSAGNTTRDPDLVGTKTREELNNGSRDTWLLDERIPDDWQVGHKEFYLPSIFDRGHIFRREDGYWGRTEEEAEAGNFDTFHYTNCTPQHPRFNQSRRGGEWGELENHIADEVGAERYTIFAGPIFRSDDPVIEGVQVPRRFWKVVVATNGDDLGAWAFVLDQSRFPFEAPEEAFDAGDFVNRQTTVHAIEEATDVRFPDVVRRADVLAGRPANESIVLESLASIRGLG
ncbi:DNA/RNA non-specific endonuclease [Minicystis rosea]|nr:DNA/RNA non-specific endonuclease [Minicystis rosea]